MEQSRIAQSIGIALDRFIKNNQEQFQYASGELSQLLRDIALASKVVNREVNKAGLIDIMGALGSQNSAGDEQQKLDVLANIRFTRALTKGGEVGAIISEETESWVDLNNSGKYVVAIDPLDGSSNIDVNVSIGTIFSIYRRKSDVGTPIDERDVLQKGSEQVASGYILYGSSTMLVYTTGHGVNGFTYEPTLGEYFLSHPDQKMPEDGKIFSVNEGPAKTFPKSVLDYLNYCKEKEFTARYIGSLVADFHRNMMKGGQAKRPMRIVILLPMRDGEPSSAGILTGTRAPAKARRPAACATMQRYGTPTARHEPWPMTGSETGTDYLANLRRELTRALARQQRAERERDEALAEVARLRALLQRLGHAADP